MRSHAGQNVLADLVGGAHGGAELLDVRFDGGMDLLGGIVETEMLGRPVELKLGLEVIACR